MIMKRETDKVEKRERRGWDSAAGENRRERERERERELTGSIFIYFLYVANSVFSASWQRIISPERPRSLFNCVCEPETTQQEGRVLKCGIYK